MLRVRTALAVTAAALLAAAPAAHAADVTAPVLTYQAGNFLLPKSNIGVLRTAHYTGLGTGYGLESPGIAVSSNEAGTLTFIGRELSGKAIGRISGPVAAGVTIRESDQIKPGDPYSRTIDSYIFPTTVVPCVGATTECGEQYRLKNGNFYSIEVFVTDAAGNRSTTYKLWSLYTGTRNALIL